MDWHIVVTCGGHRHGQPCRGALHTRARDQRYAADDQVTLSRRNAEFHPFIEVVEVWEGDFVFAGPEATRRAGARKRGEGEGGIDAIEYEITADINGELRLQKVED